MCSAWCVLFRTILFRLRGVCLCYGFVIWFALNLLYLVIVLLCLIQFSIDILWCGGRLLVKTRMFAGVYFVCFCVY